MKYILSLLLSAVWFLFLTGCSLPTPVKRDIYQAVTTEIDDAMNQGDELYKTGYYADAIKAYQTVNYYEDRPVVSRKKISRLQKNAKQYASILYKRAMQLVNKNKIKALFKFNKMMRCDPDYKDGKEQFAKLKKDLRVRKFLTKLEVHLQNAWDANPKQSQYAMHLDKAYQKVISYDDNDPIAVKINRLLHKERMQRIEKGITLFNKGELTLAKKQFLSVQSFDKKDRTIKRYLEKIDAYNQDKEDKTAFKHLLQNAQKAYGAQDYIMAIEYVKKALDIDKDNYDARQLKIKANEGLQTQIPLLLSQAENYYKEKNLRKALNIFNQILLTDPHNNTSKTYIRKIGHQLKTIESLK